MINIPSFLEVLWWLIKVVFKAIIFGFLVYNITYIAMFLIVGPIALHAMSNS